MRDIHNLYDELAGSIRELEADRDQWKGRAEQAEADRAEATDSNGNLGSQQATLIHEKNKLRVRIRELEKENQALWDKRDELARKIDELRIDRRDAILRAAERFYDAYYSSMHSRMSRDNFVESLAVYFEAELAGGEGEPTPDRGIPYGEEEGRMGYYGPACPTKSDGNKEKG